MPRVGMSTSILFDSIQLSGQPAPSLKSFAFFTSQFGTDCSARNAFCSDKLAILYIRFSHWGIVCEER